MSGVAPDPLDRIQSWASSIGHPPGSMNANVLALVEIARAARVFRDHALPHEHLFDGQDLRRFEALNAALARLEGAA